MPSGVAPIITSMQSATGSMPGLEVDAIGPDIDVAPGRQVTLLPARVVVRPSLLQPRDDRGRQVGRVLAQQDAQRLLEITGRDAAQVQDRQQGIQTSSSVAPSAAAAPS